MVDRLGHEIDEANAERLGCLAEASQRRDVGSRMEALAKSGTVSQIRTAEALASQEATSTRCGMADARLHRLEIESAPHAMACSCVTVLTTSHTHSSSATG